MDLKKTSLYIQATFYLMAGSNHFFNAGFYYPLIPGYLQGFSGLINIMSGVIEMTFGLMLFISKTRKIAAFGIMLMLIAFIPSHAYFIQIGSCIESGLCVPAWVGWIRLLIIHPLLLWWAFSVRMT